MPCQPSQPSRSRSAALRHASDDPLPFDASFNFFALILFVRRLIPVFPNHTVNCISFLVVKSGDYRLITSCDKKCLWHTLKNRKNIFHLDEVRKSIHQNCQGILSRTPLAGQFIHLKLIPYIYFSEHLPKSSCLLQRV